MPKFCFRYIFIITSTVEEFHSLYRSPIIVRVIKFRRLKWADHVVRMEEDRSTFEVLTGKHTGKRPFGRR